MAENMLLEYTEGMDTVDVGWSRVDIHKLRELMQIHTAHEELTARASYIARVESSNLLFHILRSMEQATEDHPLAGALTKPGDRLLLLVGHDTIAHTGHPVKQSSNIAGDGEGKRLRATLHIVRLCIEL
jgi:hypothetical protein